jgi:hypothetical protein
MKPWIKHFLLGFLFACVLGIGGSIAFSLFYDDRDMTFHEHKMPSGRSIKITMCDFLYGVEHNDRYEDQDCFRIDYIMSSPHVAREDQDREALEVFELIRPISEGWTLHKAQVFAFPALRRKGTFYVYSFTQRPDGQWDFRRDSTRTGQ